MCINVCVVRGLGRGTCWGGSILQLRVQVVLDGLGGTGAATCRCISVQVYCME